MGTRNRIEIKHVGPQECPVVRGEKRILESYEQYLGDESRLDYSPVAAVYFPRNTPQVADAVKSAVSRGQQVVVSGSRTGIVGGAVGVENASIICLERMDSHLGDWRFQAGVKLEDIPCTDSAYYPVDPTETTASIGGTVATDASGARTYHYGSTRDFVSGLTIVLADGTVLEVHRGEVFCEEAEFVLERRDGNLVVPVAGISMPPVKNTAGLYLKTDMDLVDLFVGSEGTLGIVTEVETRTAPLPRNRLFLVVYAPDEIEALDLVETVRSDDRLECLAIEYFGPNAIQLLRGTEDFPNIGRDASCAVYLETLSRGSDAEEAMDEVLLSLGLDASETWAGIEREDMEEMKRFRHAVPETVNSMIGERKLRVEGLHKVGTDTAVPEGKLREFLAFARREIENEGMEYVVFGHVGDNHLHVNMLPRSHRELEAANELYLEIARESVRLGGTISAEHGIGRLKKELMRIQFSPEELDAMRSVKKALDPEGVLNPGVMF